VRDEIFLKRREFRKALNDFAPYLQGFAAVHRKPVSSCRKLARQLFPQKADAKKASQT
jgi:hypothetical protein